MSSCSITNSWIKLTLTESSCSAAIEVLTPSLPTESKELTWCGIPPSPKPKIHWLSKLMPQQTASETLQAPPLRLADPVECGQ